ncbi:hypothetical protein SprV_0501855800 [Sparganum proliferum]
MSVTQAHTDHPRNGSCGDILFISLARTVKYRRFCSHSSTAIRNKLLWNVFVNIVRDVFDDNEIHRRRLDAIILHDNAPVHRSKETVSISACGRQSIFIPANCPDLNSIENLFALIKIHSHKANKKLSMHEKFDFILDSHIEQATVDKLTTSMPERPSRD